MSTNEAETQPIQEVNVSPAMAMQRPLPRKADEDEQFGSVDEQQEDAIPVVKSGVRVDPNAALVRTPSQFAAVAC